MAALADRPAPASTEPAAVEARGVRVFFGDRPILRGVSLAVAPGTNVALVGPNGAGKSTLLRVLAGLIAPAKGEILIAGRSFGADPTGCRRQIGMVGHQPMLHPELTARENLRFYARLYDLDRCDERVADALRRVDLLERADSRATTLSRGMVQRLALARALLHEPSVLLLDEPETGLDAHASTVLAATLRDPEAGRAVVMASHDLDRVRELADRVVFLNHGRVVGTTATTHHDVGSLHERYAEALAYRPPPRGAREPAVGPPVVTETRRGIDPQGRAALPRTVAALVWRDLLAEYRTRDVLGGGVIFALLVLVVFNFAIDLRIDNAEEIAPGILWIGFTFAGMLGFGRSFAAERERGGLDGLLLAPIDRGAIYLARTITNIILMAIVELVSLPVFVALYNVRVAWSEILAVVALGTIGFSGAGTLVAAIAANTRAREVMLPVLLLPLAVPVLIASVKATAVAIGARPVESLPWLQLLIGFDVVVVAASYLVFEYILEE